MIYKKSTLLQVNKVDFFDMMIIKAKYIVHRAWHIRRPFQ